MLQNYKRQLWRRKEWIIVLNLNGAAHLARFQKMASKHKHVRVYQLPARYSLGRCLNFATARANYSYITKMDDDEYYAPYYLTGIMRTFRKTGADIVGKRAYFIHLAGSRMLLQRFNPANRYTGILAGGTISYRKYVWRQVKFRNRTHGEDVHFCWDSQRKGYKMYAGGRYNFCALRRKDPNSHTWKVTDAEFIRHPQTRIVAKNVTNYRKYVDRTLK
jgi:cellulose synthase/poly-beta-1,6-N-acetylglucosamine synthase-like glycosyltransferase